MEVVVISALWWMSLSRKAEHPFSLTLQLARWFSKTAAWLTLQIVMHIFFDIWVGDLRLFTPRVVYTSKIIQNTFRNYQLNKIIFWYITAGHIYFIFIMMVTVFPETHDAVLPLIIHSYKIFSYLRLYSI